MRESGSPARFAADTEGLKTFSAQITWGDTSGALQRFREAVKEIPIGLVPADGLERLLDYPGSLPPSFRPLVESARAYRARLAATY